MSASMAQLVRQYSSEHEQQGENASMTIDRNDLSPQMKRL
jgi:hypothetical protein